MKNKIKQLSKSQGIHQTVVTGLGNYTSALVSAVAIILISRNLGPSLFGEFSAAFSLAMILARLNDGGITIATQKFASQSKNKTEVVSFMQYGYKLKIYLSVLILLITLPLSPFISSVFKFSNQLIVPVSITLGLLLVYYDQLVATLLATHSFLKAAFVNLSQAGFKLITAIIITNFSPHTLLPLLGTFLLAPGIPFFVKQLFEPKWFTQINKAEISLENRQKVIQLAKHSALLVFVMGIMDSVGVLFVKGYLDSYNAGLLGGISRIALLFTLIGVSLSQVLNNRVSRYTEKSDLDSFITKSLYLSAGAVILFLLTLPLLKPIITLTIGSEYLAASNSLAVLLGSVFLYIISVPYTALFYSFEKNEYFSYSGVLQIVTIVIANMLLVPTYGVLGSAFSQLISRGVLLVFTVAFATLAYLEKYKQLHPLNQEKII